MNALLFTDADVFAGTERHMLDLSAALRRAGINSTIACPVPSPLAQRSEVQGIDVLGIRKRGLIDWAAVAQLRQQLLSGTDVIHAHNGRTALNAAIAVRAAGRGHLVFTQHFLEPRHVSRRGISGIVSGIAHRWVRKRIDRFIAITSAVRDEMIARGECAPDSVSVVLNGIADPTDQPMRDPQEVRAELGVAAELPLILCAARLEQEKGIGTLIEALQLVRPRQRFQCVIAGEGSQRAVLQHAINVAGLQEQVRLLGFRADVLSLVQACDVFVLPSPAEPFGLVLLEAMALSKPVVACSSGGPIEIVSAGETGLLVPPSNAEALAAALRTLLENRDLAVRFGERGRARYERMFTSDRMGAEVLAVYRQVLGAGVEEADARMLGGQSAVES